MNIRWTPDQLKAIHTTGQNLLVSAAAGSGKTAVLAARCAYLVCDAPDPCDVTELLVVTFTNAAADEMKKRIGQAIAQKAAGSDDPHLQRQMLLAGAAQISTIHSLGQSIIRRHFHELGVDPAFRLLDQDEARLLRAELVDDLLESRFDDETATDFRKLVDLYGNGIPHAVAGLVLGLHAKLSSLIDRDAWLRDRRAKLVEAADKPLNQSEIGLAVINAAREQIRTLADSAARLERIIDTYPTLGAYGVHVRGIESHLRTWEETIGVSSWDALAADIVAFKPETIPRLKASPEKEAMQAKINDLKDRIKTFVGGGLFAFAENQLREGVRGTIWVTDQITSLVTDFDSAYTSAKRDAGTLDFNDLEHLALRLLQEPGSDPPAPSRIAREYQRQFRYVMVDEYQDVNQVQDTLLALLGRERSHFAVGDVKQSIYRFRQADPRRFIDRYVRYKKEKPAPGEVIDLQKNFRSRAPLLEALNGVFESLMTKESAEVAYSASQRLVPSATYADGDGLFIGTPIELHVIEKQSPGAAREFDNDEREAIIAVTRIRDLIGRAKVANRDGSNRPMEYRDVVILLRTMRIKAEHFATILRRAGIPVHADSSSGYFAATEIGDMLSVLKLLASSRDDIALAAFLRSPLSGWAEAEDKLAQIRLAYPTKVCPCFHQAFEQYRTEKDDELALLVKTTCDQLDKWRQISQNKPVADVLWAILENTSYLSYISGLPDGEQRVANVMDLHSRARQFEAFQRPTVARFLAFLGSLQEDGDLGMPAAAGVAQNAVRIMSIHKSKGLEFPVVILPDLGKAHNLRDATDKLLFDDAVGIAARAVDADKEVHYATLATTLAAHEIRRKQIAEELRVLYVAGTRAREHLILIGTAAEGCFTDWDDTWASHAGPIPAGDVRDAGCMLAWVGPAISIVETRVPGSFQRTWHAASDIDAEAQRMLSFRAGDTIPATIAGLKPLQSTPDRSKAVAAAIARLEQTYPFKSLTTIPAVTSVTASTKSGRTAPGGKSISTSDVVSFEHELRLPRALAETKVLSPADRGTIMHAVLQRIDLAKIRDAASLDAELTSLVGRRFLSNDDLLTINRKDRDSILWLLTQPIGKALSSAKDLRRELSITYTKIPDDAAADSTDMQMVRGRLDAVIVEDDGLTIVDYKTDNVTAETIDPRAAFYEGQMKAYRTHIETLTGRPVKAAHLVFLTVQQVRSV